VGLSDEGSRLMGYVKAEILFTSVNNRPDSLKAICLQHFYRSVAIQTRPRTGCERIMMMISNSMLRDNLFLCGLFTTISELRMLR
jgi:hypothetical protein